MYNVHPSILTRMPCVIMNNRHKCFSRFFLLLLLLWFDSDREMATLCKIINMACVQTSWMRIRSELFCKTPHSIEAHSLSFQRFRSLYASMYVTQWWCLCLRRFVFMPFSLLCSTIWHSRVSFHNPSHADYLYVEIMSIFLRDTRNFELNSTWKSICVCGIGTNLALKS